MVSPIEIKRLELAALEAVEQMQEAQSALNKARVSSGLPPAGREFVSREEHEAAIAKVTPKPNEPPKRRFELSGGDPMTEMRRNGYDLEAEHQSLQRDDAELRQMEAEWTERYAPIRARKGTYGEGFADAWMSALWTFHPRFVAHERRYAAYSRAHENSPQGRADRAWCEMVDKAAALLTGGDRAKLFKLRDGAIVKALASGDPSKVDTSVAPADVKATKEMILRAGAMRRGEIVELPTHPTARAIVAAGAKRRGEEFPDPSPLDRPGGKSSRRDSRARGENDDRLSSSEPLERKLT
jgi:hypothetical protein